MPEPESQLPVILLSSCAGLLVLVLFFVFRISRRLSRIESALSRTNDRSDAVEHAPSSAETSPGGAFEAFLAEDPARLQMTKAEQFAAYRQWRHENGMNWSNS
jgi:hypothetical protein